MVSRGFNPNCLKKSQAKTRKAGALTVNDTAFLGPEASGQYSPGRRSRTLGSFLFVGIGPCHGL